ncbi:MAG: hypothetical protein COB59_09365 [Rhodospirillaceae bacterium]|nr:MAG: hypothetical protein COB59_09365 [Rhodospirillaceae bacterium]
MRCCVLYSDKSINEAARDQVRSLNGSDVYNRSARDRKKIERLFGEAKRNMAMTRLRLRGLCGAKDEFLLTATVQNLKRLAKLVSKPPPKPMMA